MSLESKSTPIALISSNRTFEVVNRVETTPGSENVVWTSFYVNGALVGSPVRWMLAGDRITLDYPGVDSNYFVTNDQGKITPQ